MNWVLTAPSEPFDALVFIYYSLNYAFNQHLSITRHLYCQQPSKLCAQDKSGIICTYYDVIENDKPIDLKKLVLDNLIAIRVKNENDNFNTWRLKLKTPKGFVPVHDDKVKSSIKWLKG